MAVIVEAPFIARTNLRKSNFQIIPLTETAVESRLDTVLKTLYLLFNEGYFSKSNMRQIRKDLCSEVVRLMVALTNNKLTNKPQVNALLALMCYQSSRLDARTAATGEAVLYDDQDQNLWDQALIQKGNFYLVNATNDQKISKYHLEAGIAYWHTSQSNQNKWKHILQLYNQLILIDHSPAATLNRIFALAKVKGENQALKEAEKLGLVDNSQYHQLLGYLYEQSNPEMAIEHYQQAILLLKSETEKQTLAKKITFLTRAELDWMASKEFASDRLAQVRDTFPFCCSTGLAYSDVQKRCTFSLTAPSVCERESRERS